MRGASPRPEVRGPSCGVRRPRSVVREARRQANHGRRTMDDGTDKIRILRQRRPKLIITLSAALILAVVVVLQALHTLDARRRALESAEQRASNLTRVLSV